MTSEPGREMAMALGVGAIVELYRRCGFTTASEGMDLIEAAYPGHPIEPRTQFLLEELFGPARPRGDCAAPSPRDEPRVRNPVRPREHLVSIS